MLVRGELKDAETRPTLVSGEQFIRLMGKEALPGPGTYDVRGQVLDVGRLQADDPRLSGIDLGRFGIEADRWPRQGEVVVLKVSSIEKAEPLPAPSIRALALDPERYVDQRVTVTGPISRTQSVRRRAAGAVGGGARARASSSCAPPTPRSGRSGRSRRAKASSSIPSRASTPTAGSR